MYEQGRLHVQSMAGGTSRDGWTSADYLAVFNEGAFEEAAAPEAPAGNASAAAVALWTSRNNAHKARTKAQRTFIDVSLRAALHPSVAHVICEVDQQGRNRGSSAFSVTQVMDRMEAKWGVANDNDISEQREKFLAPFDPTKETYEVFLASAEDSRNFLTRHGENPSRYEMYQAAKEHVKHLSIFKTAISSFEITNTTTAARTFGALTTVLATFAVSNAPDIAMTHVMNQATKAKTTASSEAGVHRQMIVDQVTAALGSQVLTDAKAARLAKVVQKAIERELNPPRHPGHLPKGSCTNHPEAQSHTTAQCKIPANK